MRGAWRARRTARRTGAWHGGLDAPAASAVTRSCSRDAASHAPPTAPARARQMLCECVYSTGCARTQVRARKLGGRGQTRGKVMRKLNRWHVATPGPNTGHAAPRPPTGLDPAGFFERVFLRKGGRGRPLVARPRPASEGGRDRRERGAQRTRGGDTRCDKHG
ncbi:MAG: hypothetical protein J3K34DRAFT_438750 [Monoraphidium minutum]|nr:MAG: hypothetical protein J3K34DRAFT_438750 [Monoraphidium minutum]